jgi:hypothetical protein
MSSIVTKRAKRERAVIMQTGVVICYITSPVLRIKLENAGEFNKRENSKTNKTEQLNNDTNRREHTRLEKLIEEKIPRSPFAAFLLPHTLP